MIPHVHLKMPFGYGRPQIHCPACGKHIGDEDTTWENLCPHVIFLYLPDVGEFSYVAPAYQSLVDEIMDDPNLEDVSPVETLVERLERPGAMALTLSHGGMGHGPVWVDDVVAVDFAPDRE